MLQERFKVNGKTISLGDKASESDKIYVDGILVVHQPKLYLIFNKPVGCVTAVTDANYKTVFDYIDIEERIFPVGRLDYMTSGLLLLTNDGDFANGIMHPRYEVKKTYLVQLARELVAHDRSLIENGLELVDGKTHPAKVKILKENYVEIQIHEGRNRIVRRMMEKLGYGIRTLERTGVGVVSLGSLAPGKYRKLTQKEIKSLSSMRNEGGFINCNIVVYK